MITIFIIIIIYSCNINYLIIIPVFIIIFETVITITKLIFHTNFINFKFIFASYYHLI